MEQLSKDIKKWLKNLINQTDSEENLNRKVRLKNPNGTDFILPDEMPIDIEGKLENKTIKNAIFHNKFQKFP